MGAIRRRIRHLFLLAGVFRLAVAVAALLVLSFLLDRLLGLPLAVRYASAFVALAVVVIVAIRALVYPLSIRIEDDDLALAAEARLPDLEDRLISALQFERQMRDPENPESAEMMRAVIADAATLSDVVRAKQITSARRVRRAGLLAAAGAAVLVVLAIAFPGSLSVWAERNLLLMDVRWPRSTTMVVEGFPASREIVVTKGETVRVKAVAKGKVPDDVRIGYQRLGGNAEITWRPMFEEEGGHGRFRFDFRQVPASFRFRVVGGDDTDGLPVFTVRALVPPTIESIDAACEFPKFTGMPAKTFHEGDLDLPMGTRVSFELHANMPLAKATMAIGSGKKRPLTLSPDGRTALTRFQVKESFDYRIRLTGKEGQENLPNAARYHIRSVPDRKPDVRIVYPGERENFTPQASVPVRVYATDNYGVARISIFTRRGRSGKFVERRFSESELSAPLDSKQIMAYVLLPIKALAGPGADLTLGDQITWFAEAEDNNGNTARSAKYRIDILSSDDLERLLSQRQQLLRENAAGTTREQRSARQQTADLLDFMKKGGTLAARDRERIRDDQVLQDRITRETNRFYESVSRVLVSYVLNRLATPVATERILGFLNDDLSSRKKLTNETFSKAVFRKIAADYRAGNIIDQQVLAVLIEIVDLSLDISTVSSPQAQSILADLSQGRTEKGLQPDLEKVLEIQTKILRSMDDLDRKMQRWESYAELVDLARDILDLQRDVRQGADRVLKGK